MLSVSHGIGAPSISVLLHELAKLIHYAGCDVQSVPFIRVGTCGGLGVEPGTVIVTSQVYDGLLRPEYSLPICGKLVVRETCLDDQLAEELMKPDFDFPVR